VERSHDAKPCLPAAWSGSRRVSAGYDDDRPGWRFFLRASLAIIVIGILAFVGFLVFISAVYAFGILGAFILFAAILLVYGWIRDRRHPPEDAY
jgi:uncharacterized membrane protein HdeD (DUF308 family)